MKTVSAFKHKGSLVPSLSGGKDSTALVLWLYDNKIPMADIVYYESGWDFPQMEEHLALVEDYVKQKITRLRPRQTFDYMFSELPIVANKGKNKGKVTQIGRGWPYFNRRWCTGRKQEALNCYSNALTYRKGIVLPVVQCVGFAADEEHRADKMKRANSLGKYVECDFPLIHNRITEKHALEYCYERGFTWGGCIKFLNGFLVSVVLLGGKRVLATSTRTSLNIGSACLRWNPGCRKIIREGGLLHTRLSLTLIKDLQQRQQRMKGCFFCHTTGGQMSKASERMFKIMNSILTMNKENQDVSSTICTPDLEAENARLRDENRTIKRLLDEAQEERAQFLRKHTIQCPACDFGSGQRGMDTCGYCGGTGRKLLAEIFKEERISLKNDLLAASARIKRSEGALNVCLQELMASSCCPPPVNGKRPWCRTYRGDDGAGSKTDLCNRPLRECWEEWLEAKQALQVPQQ